MSLSNALDHKSAWRTVLAPLGRGATPLRVLSTTARRLAAWAVSAVLLTVCPAIAAPVSITSGTTTYLAEGASLNLTFDVGVAGATIGAVAPFNIASGSITFFFADDGDSVDTTSQINRSFSNQLCSPLFGSVVCQSLPHFVDVTGVRSVDPREVATVTSGGTTASVGSALTLYDSRIDYPVRSFKTSCGFFGCATIAETVDVTTCGFFGCGTTAYPLYNSQVNVTEIYDGPFTLTLALGPEALLDLSVDGLLPYTISAASGDLNFLSAVLNIDLEGAPTGHVPEPTSLLLLALALVAVGGVRRHMAYRA